MPVTAGIVAGTGTVLGSTIQGISGGKAAKEMSDVAREQLAFQKKAYEKELEIRDLAFRKAREAAIPSPVELKAIDTMITRSEAQLKKSLEMISRNEKVLNSMEPAMKESGMQLYKALRGEAVPMLKPIIERRTRQKQQLEQQLAERFGPGFRSTSAGLMALNNFDTQTADTLTNASFASIDSLLKTNVSLAQAFGTEVRGNVASVQNAFAGANSGTAQGLNAEQNIKSREMQSVNPLIQKGVSTQNVALAGQSLQDAVGNAFAPGMAAGAGISQASQSFANAMMTNQAIEAFKTATEPSLEAQFDSISID